MHHLFKRRADQKKKQDNCNDDTNKFRLQKPSVNHCVLCFKPNMHDFTFEGSEILVMGLTEDTTREITVNAFDLVITKAIWEEDVTLNRQEPIEIRVEDKGILKLIFEPLLLRQTGCLRLNFKGNMSHKKLGGFFVYDRAPPQEDKVDDPEGQGFMPVKRKLNLMTVFEPCEARRCFPCWDDPRVKITYDIIVVVPKGSMVFGPTPIKAVYNHRRDPFMEVVEFKQTPKLASHTLGFSFGDYDYIESRTQDDEMLVGIYTPKGKKALAQFPLILACKAIPFFQSYFGLPLNSQKIDLVAVPDYISTPVSCWGLIFFRASDILVEPDTSVLDMMWISLIICHEITKQWFGSLATFDWWSHQWLKEGIACFAKYTFVHQVFPEMEVWTHFVTNNYQKALRMDAYHVSRPVEVLVTTVSEIEESLDEICLYKAPSLLRMIHRFVGDGPFRQGLQTYLTRYQYANATSSEFWACMQEATAKPLGTMMAPWCSVRGYPVLNITSKQEGRSRILKLTQERYYFDPSHRDPKGQGQIFSIPLSFSTRNRPTESVLDAVMDTKTLTVTIPEVAKTDWVKVNPGAIGFFRVRYPHEMMSIIVYAIREKSLPALDLLNILDDCFAFLLGGYGSTVELLSLLEAFLEEDDYPVWVTISNIFDRCLRIFDHVGKTESFQSFGKFIYGQIYVKLGWQVSEDESMQRKLLRPLVMRMMAKFNNMEVVEQCRYMLEGQWGEESNPIPIDFRYVVYKTVVMHGDDTVLKRFIRLYRDTECGEEKDKLACAIGSCRSPPQILHALDFSISEDVRRAHTIIIFNAITKSKQGKEITWTFLKENYSHFRGNFGSNQMGKIFTAILEDFASDDKVTEMQDFFKTNPFPGTEKTIQKIIEKIKVNELWLKREKNLTALQDYLESMH